MPKDAMRALRRAWQWEEEVALRSTVQDVVMSIDGAMDIDGSPERLGEAVHVALSTAKPKARYAVVPQRFKNWALPRLLPARMLDAQLAKLLGLTKS